ncbi:MAG: TIGR02300 family protein [Parvibaculales bacterium]
MSKPSLGTKRVCAHCGAKFYDLNKEVIICPKCNMEFIEPQARKRPKPPGERAVVEEAAEKPEGKEEGLSIPELETDDVDIEDDDEEDNLTIEGEEDDGGEAVVGIIKPAAHEDDS